MQKTKAMTKGEAVVGPRIGDRVSVRLPTDHGIDGRRRATGTFTGTVMEIDPRGVTVRLDKAANGVRSCYALRRELQPAP